MTPAAILGKNDMTKVQIHFRLEKPLDDLLLQRLSDTSALYGIQKVSLAPAMDSLMVEYDATRLRPEEVESALAGAGIAVKPASAQ
jgi:allophanate hydrolase subunit 1